MLTLTPDTIWRLRRAETVRTPRGWRPIDPDDGGGRVLRIIRTPDMSAYPPEHPGWDALHLAALTADVTIPCVEVGCVMCGHHRPVWDDDRVDADTVTGWCPTCERTTEHEVTA